MDIDISEDELNNYLRMEAKAIVAYAFRNTFLEDIHAGNTCPTCHGKEEYSHITNKEMKKLMKESVNKMYTLLKLKFANQEGYTSFLQGSIFFTSGWDNPEIIEEEYASFKSHDLTKNAK